MSNEFIDTADVKEIEKSLSWLDDYWKRPLKPEYCSPETVSEAVNLLEKYGKEARIIGGGIDVLGLMKSRVIAPRILINIKNIPEIKGITESSAGLTIGALTRINDLERSDLIRKKYPALYEAAHSIASPQIRNMATVAGNLCQEVRCWYYRRSPFTGISFNCRRKQSNGMCYAFGGENQYHAVIGGSECFAVCPSDLATVLLALNASVRTVGVGGSRVISLDEFFTPFGNVLGPDEVITSIEIPEATDSMKQRFLKFRVRKTIDFAIVSVAILLSFTDDIISDARVVLGGVSPMPYRASGAEEVLTGRSFTEGLAGEAAGASMKGAKPLQKNGYKKIIAEALVKRALLE